jgi:2'-hydroxyisoflavone reductase
MGRWLVLGGTRFLSAAVAQVALARGHEVVCAARGESGSVPDGATLVRVDRDEPDGLDPLRGEPFDAVVDVARMSLPWVRAALDALAPRAAHWTFVSSVSVYADAQSPGLGVDAPLLAPDDPGDYGSVKVASENAVREAVGDRAFVLRAGLICGPGDLSDRFGYWPLRFARGGRAVVPVAEQAAQIVDVRDLADWIVRAGETGLTGTFDGSGPRSTLAAVLAEVAAAVGAPDLELVPVAADDLVAAGAQPWAGPRSLPLWLPPSHVGLHDRDTAPAAKAGLVCRPVADTARGALAHERTLDPSRIRGAGLTPAEEAELLNRMMDR